MQRLKWVAFASILLLMAGCTETEPVFTSSGQRGHSIDCSGEFSDWGECYEEAGKLCGTRGYRVLEKMTDRRSSTIADKDFLSSEMTNTRNLIIQCK